VVVEVQIHPFLTSALEAGEWWQDTEFLQFNANIVPFRVLPKPL
jgi:hypothetical protein